MGWFRKMFGGGDPAAAARPAATGRSAPLPPAPPHQAVPEDPYRGQAFVEVDAVDEPVVVTRVSPIFAYRGRVLALEPNRRGPLPLRSMVYFGLADSTVVLRRVTFGEGGVRLDWEHRTAFPEASDDYVVRIGDRILFPLQQGLVALHVLTGRPCWELPHPAALLKPPLLDPDGNLILAFADQSWMVVDVRDGSTVSEGVARNNRDLDELRRPGHRLGRDQTRAHYGMVTVSPQSDGIGVQRGQTRTDDDPEAPSIGSYPIDGEWTAGGWVVLAGGKLAVDLGREWGDKRWAAVGLLDPTSLEPLQLLELGQVTTSVTCYVVDGLLVLDTDVSADPDDVMFVVDPAVERVVAIFREEKADAYLFDRDGERIWEKPL